MRDRPSPAHAPILPFDFSHQILIISRQGVRIGEVELDCSDGCRHSFGPLDRIYTCDPYVRGEPSASHQPLAPRLDIAGIVLSDYPVPAQDRLDPKRAISCRINPKQACMWKKFDPRISFFLVVCFLLSAPTALELGTTLANSYWVSPKGMI